MNKKHVVIGIALGVLALVGLALLVAGGLWMGSRGSFLPHMNMMKGFGGIRWGMHPLAGGLIGLLLVALLAGALAFLVVGLAGHKGRASGGEPTVASSVEPTSALEILKRRYAGGELDREEYERMRQELLS